MVTEHIVMQKYKFSCPVVKSKLKDYKSINQKLLKFFESCEGETVDHATHVLVLAMLVALDAAQVRACSIFCHGVVDACGCRCGP